MSAASISKENQEFIFMGHDGYIPIDVNAFSDLKSISDSLFIVQSLHHAPNLLLHLSDFLQKVPHIPMHLSDQGIRCKSTLQSNYKPLLLALTSSE